MAQHVRGRSIQGIVRAASARHAGNAVVYVETFPGVALDVPEQPVIVDQARLTFVPHVLPIVAGTTVEFVNSDVVLHNVFTPDHCAGNVDLGTWPKGNSKTHTFDEPCAVTLLCNVHPEMEAFVVVLDTPWFAVTDVDGKFRIEGVPPGRHTLRVWHERLRADPVEVVVPETGMETVRISLVP